MTGTSNSLVQIPDVLRRCQILSGAVKSTDSADVFTALDLAIDYAYNLREAAGVMLCYSLALMKDHWYTMPYTDVAHYDSFYDYARHKTGSQYTNSALINMIDVGKTFVQGFLNGSLDLPDKVELYDEVGEPTGEIVEPDILHVNTSKLVYAKAAAKDGRLQDDKVALGQLLNDDVPPRVVNDTLQGRVHQQDDTSFSENGKIRFFVEGPLLMVGRGDDADWLAEVNWEGGPLAQEGLGYLKAALSVKGLE
jgi:hypothetical protein